MKPHPDQAKREKIPTRADIPTKFHPMHDLLMVVPIPNIDHVGQIILPDKAQIILNEGHIVEKGPRASDQLDVGDCVTWDANSEYRMNVDGVPFVLVRETVINMRIPHHELRPFENPAQGKLSLTEGELLPPGHLHPLVVSEDCGKDGVYQCLACGEKSSVEYAAIQHAVGCPEHISEQTRKSMA